MYPKSLEDRLAAIEVRINKTDFDLRRLENKVDIMIDMMKTVMGLSGKSRLIPAEMDARADMALLKFRQKQKEKEERKKMTIKQEKTRTGKE